MAVEVLVDLSTALAIIGVMFALFLRAERMTDEVEVRSESRLREVEVRSESRLREMEARIESRFDKVDERFEKVDARFDKVDARFDKVDARFDKVDERFGFMARDLVEVKVSVARIEGHLQAGEGFRPAGRDRRASRPDVDQPPAGYRQAG